MPDFVLVMKNVTTNATVTDFAVSGESYNQMCPSHQCVIEYGSRNSFSTPDPEWQNTGYSIGFKIKDNITLNDIGEKKKQFLEEFGAFMIACKVDNIVEDNGQELYYYHDESNSIERQFDSKRWYYNSTGIYDAKAGSYNVTGNFTHTS